MVTAISIAMLVFSLIIGAIILAYVIRGFFKGWKKCLVSLCKNLAAAILAFFIVFIFCRLCPSGTFFKLIFGSLIKDTDVILSSASVQQLAGLLVYTVVMPFVFLIFFFILNGILTIPKRAVERKLGLRIPKKKKSKKKSDDTADNQTVSEERSDETVTAEEIENIDEAADEVAFEEHTDNSSKASKIFKNLGGSGLRLVTAALVLMITLLPFTGIFYTVTDGIVKIADTAAELDGSIKIGSANMSVMGHEITDDKGKLVAKEADLLIHETLDPVRDNVFFKLSYSAPMKFVYNSFSGSKNAEGKLTNEISQVFDVVADAAYLTADMKNYGQAQKDAVTRLFAYVSKSDLHCAVASDILSGVSKNVLADKQVLGSDFAVLKKEPLSIASYPLLEILSETTPATVKEDLDTMRDVIIIMIDYEIPPEIAVALAEKNSNNIYKAFGNEAFIYDILVTTYHTKDYRHMTAPVINLMFTVFTRRFDPNHEVANVANENVENLTDEDLKAEAAIFANLMNNIHSVLGSVSSIKESKNTMAAVANSNMEFLGAFADKAKESKFIGEGTTELIIAILESDTMNSMRDVSNIMVKHIKADPNLDLSNLFVAVQEFVSILDKYENANGQDTAELAKSLGELNKSFKDDRKTAEIMKEIINDTNMVKSSSLSAGEEKNDSSQKMMTVFVDKLAENDYTEEELEHEAKALDYSMQLIKASGQENSSEKLKEIYGGEKMADMVDVMSDSDISSAAINEIAYDENGNKTDDALELSSSMDDADRANFVTQCEQTYNKKLDAFTANPENSAEDIEEYKNTLKTNMTSLASVFGETLDFDSWDASRAQ